MSAPTYRAQQSVYHELGDEIRPGFFDVFETLDGVERFSFCMHNGGDRFQEILKRGIPEDQARKIFYEMDSK